MCKEIGVQLAGQDLKDSVFTVNPIADQLGLVDASGPRAILAVAASIPMPAAASIDERSQPAAGEVDGMMVDTPSVPNNGPVTSSGATRGANDNGDVSMTAPPAEEDSKRGCNANTLVQQDRPEAHFYGYLLDACEKLFEGDMDQVMFEENTRFLFGTKVRLSSVPVSSFRSQFRSIFSHSHLP